MKKKQLLILLAVLVIGGAIGCESFFKKSVNITITETNKLADVDVSIYKSGTDKLIFVGKTNY